MNRRAATPESSWRPAWRPENVAVRDDPALRGIRPDLPQVRDLAASAGSSAQRVGYVVPVRIGVVIPALDEAESIEAAIASALASADPEVAVLVVDGGSRDATAILARAAGARVLTCPAGRAQQQQAGWQASRGEVVLFLHADTQLPPGWAPALRAALRDREVVGGAFRLRFAPRGPALAVIEWGARQRARWLGLPYGDQALFVRRDVLTAIGGIPRVPILEDLDLVRAMRRRGPLVLLPLDAVTSSRRYRQRGVLRTWGRHVLALVAWCLGVDRERLAAWLRR